MRRTALGQCIFFLVGAFGKVLEGRLLGGLKEGQEVAIKTLKS